MSEDGEENKIDASAMPSSRANVTGQRKGFPRLQQGFSGLTSPVAGGTGIAIVLKVGSRRISLAPKREFTF